MKERYRDPKEYATGFSDNLIPLSSLDVTKAKDADELLEAMKLTAFGGRSLGEAADVLYDMTNDKECFIVGTFSGAMTVAKMGLLICEMIERKMLHAIVATGALVTHGFVQDAGLQHFKYRPDMDDRELYLKGYNRVYDTLELESNLDDAATIVGNVLKTMDPKDVLCSAKITRALGKYLDDKDLGRGILRSAYKHNVPVYIPAFTDSELGLDIGIYRRKCKLAGKPEPTYDPYLDLEDYTAKIYNAKKVGIFTIGGGVPRNWAQQVGPYLDIIQSRIGKGGGKKRFHYGIRICPEPVHWGGLSGCSYSEGVSWGKFVPPNEGGKWSEVLCDATIAWPILVKGVIERMEKTKKSTKK